MQDHVDPLSFLISSFRPIETADVELLMPMYALIISDVGDHAGRVIVSGLGKRFAAFVSANVSSNPVSIRLVR